MQKVNTRKWLQVAAVALLLGTAAVIIASCNGAATRNDTHSHRPVITATALRLPGGWGYKIEVDHHLFIYQSQVPCLPGKQLFPTKASAMAIADAVVQKMKAGRLPTVTKQDLEKLTPSLVANH